MQTNPIITVTTPVHSKEEFEAYCAGQQSIAHITRMVMCMYIPSQGIAQVIYLRKEFEETDAPNTNSGYVYVAEIA